MNRFDEAYNKIMGCLVDDQPTTDYLTIYKDENGDDLKFVVYKNDDYIGEFYKDQMEGNFGASWSNHLVDGYRYGSEGPLATPTETTTTIKEEVDYNWVVVLVTDDKGTTRATKYNDTNNKVKTEVRNFGEDSEAATNFYEEYTEA